MCTEQCPKRDFYFQFDTALAERSCIILSTVLLIVDYIIGYILYTLSTFAYTFGFSILPCFFLHDVRILYIFGR